MSMRFKVTLVAAAVAMTPLVATGSAEASTPVCAFPKKFSKVVYLPKPKNLHSATKKHPGGWVNGKYAKFVPAEENDGYYEPYGKKHTVYFAKKPVICLWYNGDQGLAYKRGTFKQLQKAVAHPETYPTYGLTIKNKRITKIIQLWHP